MSSFESPGFPIWAKIGAGVVGVLVVVVLIVVLVSPSSPSQKGAGISLPVTAGPTTTTATTRTTLAHGSVDAHGGIGVTHGTKPPPLVTTTTATTAPPAPHGLRIATAAELTAIAADVPPPAGQQIDGVMIAISDPTWGLIHVSAGAGQPQEYVLITLGGGKWAPVDSGYPSMPCYTGAPVGVQTDLGARMAGCQPTNPNGN